MPIITMSQPSRSAPAAAGFHVRHVPVQGSLCDFVSGLMAVEISARGPIPLSVAPHDALMLSLQLGRDADCIEQKGEHGQNTHLTGIRQWTGTFHGAGDCISLFALLTPLGAVQLLQSRPLDATPRIRVPVAALLDRSLTRQLESDIALASGLDAKLSRFAQWLEGRVLAQRRQCRAALRAARAAMQLRAAPGTPMAMLADRQHVSRRQLERDFARHVGTSPHHLAQVARVQWVSRKAQTGAPLADIAADLGYADQAHMSRSIREITGLTPRAFVRSQRTPMASAFRAATGGGTVYL